MCPEIVVHWRPSAGEEWWAAFEFRVVARDELLPRVAIGIQPASAAGPL